MIKAYRNLAYLFLGFLVLFDTLFYKSGILLASRTSFAVFFLFVLPGFSLLYKKEFLERVVFGFIIGLILVGVPSYYMGVVGFHVGFHWALPPVIILIGLFLEKRYRDGVVEQP